MSNLSNRNLNLIVIKFSEMRRSRIFIIIFIVVELGYLIWGDKILTSKLNDEYYKFNSANINGEIQHISIMHHRIFIKLSNDSAEYVFNPESINFSSSFLNIANNNDRIFKPSYSDTIFLFSNGNVYKFSFEKGG